MAVNTLPAFTLDAAAGASFGSAASATALPGSSLSTDTIVLVTNLGPCHVAVKLAATGAAAIAGLTPSTGVVIPAGHQLALAIAAGQAFIGGVSCGGTGTGTTANIATGN
jgi:hypothetical protein